MKAIVFEEYGSPDVLQLKEIEKPIPKDNEVLVKNHAASINDWDWGNLRGKPFINRLLFGFKRPKYKILGADIAGRVESVGRNVKLFQPGDKVFGDLCESGWGAFAEYVCAHENALTSKPDSMSYEQAAAIPQAAMLAVQGLRNKRQLQPGQKVLINGAGGGAGTYTVQIAKLFGAEVTGVDSTEKLDMMRSIGADHVIDYTQEDFTKNGQQYDMILDNAAHHSIFDYKRSLSPGGIYIMLGGASNRIIQIMLLGPFVSLVGKKKFGILGFKPNTDLVYMKELFEAGKVVPVIDRHYPLSELADAFRYFGGGHAKGKVVITVE